jgi:two-component system nitrate/nitrite response regulator NarL
MRNRAVCCDAGGVALRCLIVDDNEQFLHVASSSLSRDGLAVVGTATTSASAIAETSKLRPDVVLVDVGLGQESGFKLARQLVETFPYLDSGVVLISTRAEEDLAELIATSHAVGFISKTDLSTAAVLDLVSAGGPTGSRGR